MAQDMTMKHGTEHSVPASSPQTPSHQPPWDTQSKPWEHCCPLDAGSALDLLKEGFARAIIGLSWQCPHRVKSRWMQSEWMAQGRSSSCTRARVLGSSRVAKKSQMMPVLKLLVL